jgi:hypothetical protein
MYIATARKLDSNSKKDNTHSDWTRAVVEEHHCNVRVLVDFASESILYLEVSKGKREDWLWTSKGEGRWEPRICHMKLKMALARVAHARKGRAWLARVVDGAEANKDDGGS